MTNTNLFRAEMIKNGYTLRTLGKKIGMSANTLCNKVNNKSVFDTEEANAICDVFGISDCATKCEIFLWHPSQK